MLSGLEILLERMKEYPLEFAANSKWVQLLDDVVLHLTEDEKRALKVGLIVAGRERFNEMVLKELAGGCSKVSKADAVTWRSSLPDIQRELFPDSKLTLNA
jgi:hypothetical protein